MMHSLRHDATPRSHAVTRAVHVDRRRGIATHGREIFVADSRNHRIQVFSQGQDDRVEVVRCFGGGESRTEGRFHLPSGVCVANGQLYVTELGNERVQVLTLCGLWLQSLRCDGPVSGVCADEEHVCTTSLEGCASLHTNPQRVHLLPSVARFYRELSIALSRGRLSVCPRRDHAITLWRKQSRLGALD